MEINKVYALLDFDGYICKAFWAANSKKSCNRTAENLLNGLYWSAIEKAAKYFKVSEEDVKPIMVASTHSWKKDVYPIYKQGRKKNEDLGKFRSKILNEYKDIIKIEQLEADEVLIMLKEYINDKEPKTPVIIFSDDKDLKYYADLYCKINLSEEIEELDWVSNIYKKYTQMLAGDKEDNITGIPKIGMIKGERILTDFINPKDFTLPTIPTIDDVIAIYKDKGISYDDCLEQLALIIPAGSSVLNDDKTSRNILCGFILLGLDVDDAIVQEVIEQSLEFIKDKADLIYG